MNPFTLDFSKYYDDIISVLKEVFGHEYSDIIEERFRSAEITTYCNVPGIKAYYNFLVDCKSRELCIKFLERIGIDVSKYNVTNYADNFTGELLDLVNGYLFFYDMFKCPNSSYAIRSFREDLDTSLFDEDFIRDYRIDFINFVRRENPPITKDTYEEFIKTDEYQKILSFCQTCNAIYDELVLELNAYEESIKEYKEYCGKEDTRYEKILGQKAIELYNGIKHLLSDEMSRYLNNCDSDKERVDKIFGTLINNKPYIEYFSEEYDEELDSSLTSPFDKRMILLYRKRYLKNMGVNIDVWEDDYYDVIKRDDVKNLIPSHELVHNIQTLRRTKLVDANRQFIYESDTFNKALNKFGALESNRQYLYNVVKDTCVFLTSGKDDNNAFIRLVFLTIRDWQCGIMDYIVLHEMIHAVESDELFNSVVSGDYRCGFEPCVFSAESSCHTRSVTKRKYERFNETLTDMFAIESRELLHKRGIYFADPKEINKSDVSNCNTNSILKDMVRPFLDKYRPLIIDARICGTIDRLKQYVGDENFEKLNDIVDCVDSLICNGLLDKLSQNQNDDPLVIEYNLQRENLVRVYASMDECYNKVLNQVQTNREEDESIRESASIEHKTML